MVARSAHIDWVHPRRGPWIVNPQILKSQPALTLILNKNNALAQWIKQARILRQTRVPGSKGLRRLSQEGLPVPLRPLEGSPGPGDLSPRPIRCVPVHPGHRQARIHRQNLVRVPGTGRR